MAWTSPWRDGQVDALEDLVIGLRGRGDVQVADDEVLVAHGRLGCSLGGGWRLSRRGERIGGAASVRAPSIGRSGRPRRARRDEVGQGHRVEGAGDRVADSDPHEVDGAVAGCARRPRGSGSSVTQIIGAIGPFEGAQDLAHRISSGARVSS